MKKNNFNFKDFKNSIMVSMGSIESYKKHIDELVEKGKKNGEDIVYLCDDILYMLDYINVSDLKLIREKVLDIKIKAGGTNE